MVKTSIKKMKTEKKKIIHRKPLRGEASAKTKASKLHVTKLKVGIQSITGCAGCQLSIYFIEDVLLELLEKIDLVAND
jgi:hypothetical protein